MQLRTGLWWNITQTLSGLKNNRGDFLMGITLAGLALSIPFFLLSVWFSLSNVAIPVAMNTEITVFTERTSSMATVTKLQSDIEKLPGVISTSLLPKDQALKFVNDTLGLKERPTQNNPLPNIIIATLGTNMSSTETAQLDTDIKKLPGVESTAYDDKWADYLTKFNDAIFLAAGVFAVVILSLVILVTMNSIKMTTRAQNDEIRALNSLGADVNFIASPYGCRGFITMALAAGISIGISWVDIHMLAQPVADFASLYSNVPVRLTMIRTDYLVLYTAFCAILGYVIGHSTALQEIQKVQAEQLL